MNCDLKENAAKWAWLVNVVLRLTYLSTYLHRRGEEELWGYPRDINAMCMDNARLVFTSLFEIAINLDFGHFFFNPGLFCQLPRANY